MLSMPFSINVSITRAIVVSSWWWVMAFFLRVSDLDLHQLEEQMWPAVSTLVPAELGQRKRYYRRKVTLPSISSTTVNQTDASGLRYLAERWSGVLKNHDRLEQQIQVV